MIETALHVLAWAYFVLYVVSIFAAPFVVGLNLGPITPRRAAFEAIRYAGLALVLWDYLR